VILHAVRLPEPLDAEGVVSNAKLDPNRMVFARKVYRVEVPTESFGACSVWGLCTFTARRSNRMQWSISLFVLVPGVVALVGAEISTCTAALLNIYPFDSGRCLSSCKC
jgi:hypothetical protein